MMMTFKPQNDDKSNTNERDRKSFVKRLKRLCYASPVMALLILAHFGYIYSWLGTIVAGFIGAFSIIAIIAFTFCICWHFMLSYVSSDTSEMAKKMANNKTDWFDTMVMFIFIYVLWNTMHYITFGIYSVMMVLVLIHSYVVSTVYEKNK